MDTKYNEFNVTDLSGISFDNIAQAFLNAFADYNVQFDRNSLQAMLKRRGFSPELSFAAFHGDRMVSFILNGIGSFNGSRTAYDTGTGTIKEYRGLGLTDYIFNRSLPLLRNAGIDQYLLEVLQDNEPAVKIYTRQGFTVTREFICYTAANDRIRQNSSSRDDSIAIVPADINMIKRCQIFADFTPSWQNSIESIDRAPDSFVYITALCGNTPVGYGVTDPASGDITQIAVRHDFRQKGIGSRLLAELASHNTLSRAKVINVDSGCTPADAFLRACGFELSCTQFEMLRKL